MQSKAFDRSPEMPKINMPIIKNAFFSIKMCLIKAITASVLYVFGKAKLVVIVAVEMNKYSIKHNFLKHLAGFNM